MRVEELVERSGDLKREVLEFAMTPRFERALRQQLQSRYGKVVVADEQELDNFFDWFIQQYRRPDGRTVVDCFVESRSDLPEAEREFLRDWRDVVEGVFEVTERDGPTLVAVNLIDDLEYRIWANVGPSIFDLMPAGSFLVTRVVPVGGQWLISGVAATYGADTRDELLSVAAEMAVRHPELVYRNPDRLARGWELQEADRAAFIEHFGSDAVVLDVAKAPERMRRFFASRHGENPVAEQWVSMLDRLDPSVESVGLVYDETDGLAVLADYRLAEEVFADPDLVRERRYRRLMKRYLTDDSVSPVPLVRLAERDHGNAERVFRRLTGNPGFSWPEDGEALLRRHKPWWYGRPPLPRTVVISDRLVPHLIAS